jgi:hypothetical protein
MSSVPTECGNDADAAERYGVEFRSEGIPWPISRWFGRALGLLMSDEGSETLVVIPPAVWLEESAGGLGEGTYGEVGYGGVVTSEMGSRRREKLDVDGLDGR